MSREGSDNKEGEWKFGAELKTVNLVIAVQGMIMHSRMILRRMTSRGAFLHTGLNEATVWIGWRGIIPSS